MKINFGLSAKGVVQCSIRNFQMRAGNNPRLAQALEKTRDGFWLKSNLTSGERGLIFENYSDATVIAISSVRSRGSRHYSIYDLIGRSVKEMVYVVIDHSRFYNANSSEFESKFLEKNKNPNSGLRRAFTNFMHKNDRHWSMCCGKKIPTS